MSSDERSYLQTGDLLRQKNPLSHCITSPIAVNDCANAVLALGARPIMAEHPEEAAGITAISASLGVSLANITDARIHSIFLSGAMALEQKKPSVIDVVGVNCSPLRMGLAKRFVMECRPAVIKGNASEIRALAGASFGEAGIDTAEFLLSANRGEPVKPLVKVASGGEMSRIMLAMKAALSDADSIETLIFDEIDTGISGMVANTVAKKMRALGEKHQVLCVTHLPQIAAYADAQYVAYKYSDAEKTHSVTRRLTESERPKELARIMGGEETDVTAMEHARTLLKSAKE